MTEEELDALTKTQYEVNAHAPEPYSEERWERIKGLFKGSVRACREQVLAQIEDDE